MLYVVNHLTKAIMQTYLRLKQSIYGKLF